MSSSHHQGGGVLEGLSLPAFPWDKLAPARRTAEAHPDGVCDLSIGTPVDPTPSFIRSALAEATDSPSYPTVIGTREVREAIRQWALRRNMTDVGLQGVIPTIGSKESVAWLPTMLGIGAEDTVLFPSCAYPTYDIGARLAGAAPCPVDPTRPDTWPDARLVWLNSPGNPDGHILDLSQLRAVLDWARERGAVVISDECYAALAWAPPFIDEGVPSLLDRRVCGDDPTNVLVLYSLSKQSNLAGYRAALMVGDPRLINAVVQVRKHAGLMVPAPVQHAMAAALVDDDHVRAQRRIYEKRREALLGAVDACGLVNDPDSAGGLYLWVCDPRGRRDCWDLVDWFAHRGIVVAPGEFYGTEAMDHVRIALTATDERIALAVERLVHQ